MDNRDRRFTPRTLFGVLLFVTWAILTVLWVTSTVQSVIHGQISPLITAIAALALMTLLAGMEGLEVSVIDRWRSMYPDRSQSELAAWLAARQFFVAIIVTTATLLADRKIVIPGSGAQIDSALATKVFDISWTGLTVLWYAQILPKHLAATNPDRYLRHLRATLFPVVEVVNRIGVQLPGGWAAAALEHRLKWALTEAEIAEEATVPKAGSLAEIWRSLPVDDRGAGGPEREFAEDAFLGIAPVAGRRRGQDKSKVEHRRLLVGGPPAVPALAMTRRCARAAIAAVRASPRRLGWLGPARPKRPGSLSSRSEQLPGSASTARNSRCTPKRARWSRAGPWVRSPQRPAPAGLAHGGREGASGRRHGGRPSLIRAALLGMGSSCKKVRWPGPLRHRLCCSAAMRGRMEQRTAVEIRPCTVGKSLSRNMELKS